MATKRLKPAPFLERTPVLEWITAGVGLALALGAIGFLVWEGLFVADKTPLLSARAGAVAQTAHGYVVDIEVRNDSHVTASAVQVEGVLPESAGAPEETATLTIDYVPGKGRRDGSMIFRRDPRGGLTVQVRGQVDP